MKKKGNGYGNGLYIFRPEISEKERKRGVFWAIYFLLCGLATIWPMYKLIGNRIYPMIGGLPFSFFWIVFVVVMIFVGVYTLYAQQYNK
ncbi:hypothetical protein [Fusibacter sp. 3D3]|uniref:hypothetical protein n=1 Tax=Fusibacter sp. 3D3 TaxID=1048380 RepID=UPI000858C29F|nr:hypothetical protein [Fusibacter sp. 3D3]GAU75927.1 hypothetical protein F3D3_0523 [Fusibacter sp. 3D3]